MELLCWLRGEKEFDSLKSLHGQLEEDEKQCRELMAQMKRESI
jgi:FAD synthase